MMTIPKNYTVIDSSNLAPIAGIDVVTTWNPKQEELDLCESQNKMYCVLLRHILSNAEFCKQYSIRPSMYCVVYYVDLSVTPEVAEKAVVDFFKCGLNSFEDLRPVGLISGNRIGPMR